MDAIIMAAGKGTRLRPLTDARPKPLIPVAGRGTLLRLLDQLPDEIDRIILLVNHLAEQIRQAAGRSWNGMPIEYVSHDPLDGTGGALRKARPHIRSERFFVSYADDLYAAADLKKLCACERGLLVFPRPIEGTKDAWRVDETGRVSDLIKVPPGTLAQNNVGVYVLGMEWFETAPVLVPGKTDEWSLPHALPQVLDRYAYRAVPATFWMPVGTPEELRLAEEALQERTFPSASAAGVTHDGTNG